MFSIPTLFIFFLLASSLLLILLLFSSEQFSPIPYFPSNKNDIPLVLKALQLSDDQLIVDLGAGDGSVIFEAARESMRGNLHTRFVAVEINPVLLLFMRVRRLFHPNRQNIRILAADLFSLNYEKLITAYRLSPTFYLYISPWLLHNVYQKIKTVPKSRIVSYMYPIPGKKEVRKLQGVHQLFLYGPDSERRV